MTKHFAVSYIAVILFIPSLLMSKKCKLPFKKVEKKSVDYHHLIWVRNWKRKKERESKLKFTLVNPIQPRKFKESDHSTAFVFRSCPSERQQENWRWRITWVKNHLLTLLVLQKKSNEPELL